MHSSWKLWDFVESRPEVVKSDSAKLVAIQTFDPFAFKMIKNRIPMHFFDQEKLHVISASEVTVEWLEDNLKSLGLFGNSESYLILNACQLSKNAKELLAKAEDLILDERFLFLEFSKEDELWKKLKNHSQAECLQIQAPGFWEIDRLLDFLCDDLQVYLDLNAKDFILNRVPGDIASFSNLLGQIRINFPDKVNLTTEQIAPLIYGVKSDQFELASDFASKKLRSFYRKLAEISDFDDLRQVFMFMQSHLLKIYDTDYTQGKSRLTKYDKEILTQAKIWKKSELDRAIKYFSTLEIKAKRKDPLLLNQLQKDHLRVF